MSFLKILLLALALSADAFTVGTSVGLRHRGPRQLFRLSFHFGLFQSLLSGAGALAGTLVISVMKSWDHWVAFGLLTVIGGRMIYGAWRAEHEAEEPADLTKGLTMVGLSVAVSIDAFAVGIGLPATGAPILLAVLTIGVVASLATFLAMRMAGRVPARLGPRLEIGAGVVLIALGVWTLVSHLTAA
jgi:manganese efflux pump family protein